MKDTIIGVLAGATLVILSWLPGAVVHLLSKPQVEKLYNKAQEAYKDKYYVKAIDMYDAALIKTKQEIDKIYEKADNLYIKANIEYDNENYPTAFSIYKGALKESQRSGIPQKIKQLIVDAETAYENKNYSEAIKNYKKALEKLERNENPKIRKLCEEAKVYQNADESKADKYKEALEESYKILEVENLCKEAEIAYNDGNYETARNKYHEALTALKERMPNINKDFNTLAQYKIAICYSNLADEINKIEKHREEAEKAYQNDQFKEFNLRYKEALEKSNKIIDEINEVNEELCKETNKLYNDKRYQEAADKYKETLMKPWNVPYESNEVEKLRQEADKAYNGGKYKEAADKYKSALTEAQKLVDIDLGDDYKKAKKAYEDKNYSGARDGYRTALAKSLKWTNNKNFGSLAFECIEEMYSNRKYFDVENSEFQENIVYLRGQMLFEKEEYAKAEDEFKKLILKGTESKFEDIIEEPEVKPGNQLEENAWYAIGNSNYKDKKYDEAINIFKKLLDSKKYASDAQFLIAQSYFLKGEFEQAHQAYVEFLKIPGSKDKTNFANEAKYKAIYCLNQLKHNDQKLRGLIINEKLLSLIGNAKSPVKDEDVPKEGLLEYCYNTFVNNSKENQFVAAAYFDKAQIHLNKEKYVDAQQSFEKAKKISEEISKDQLLVKESGEGLDYSLFKDNRLSKLSKGFLKEHPEVEVPSLIQQGDELFKDKKYEAAAGQYAQAWAKSNQKDVKLYNKFREGLSYFNAAKQSDSEETKKRLLGQAIDAYKKPFDDYKGEDFNHADNFRFNLALVYEELALVSEKEKNSNEARKYYGQIKSNKDDDAQNKYYELAQMAIAYSFEDEGKIPEAIGKYDEILKNNNIKNYKDMALIRLANLYYSSKQYDDAAAKYQEFADKYSKNEYANKARYLAGWCYYQEKKITEAIVAFPKVEGELKLDASYGKILAHKDLEEWSLLIDTAESALSEFSNTTDAQKQLLLKDIKALSEYADNFQRFKVKTKDVIDKQRKIADDPKADKEARARAQLKIGHLYYDDGDYPNAIAEYQKLIDKNPNDEELVDIEPEPDVEDILIALYQIGVCKYQLGLRGRSENKELDMNRFFNDAIKYISEALEYHEKEVKWNSSQKLDSSIKSPLILNIHYILGDANFFLNNVDTAIANFEKAVELEERLITDVTKRLFKDSHKRLGNLYSKKLRYDDAIKEYQHIIGMSKQQDTLEDWFDELDAQYQIGLIKKEQTKTDEAISELKTVFESAFEKIYKDGKVEEFKEKNDFFTKYNDLPDNDKIYVADIVIYAGIELVNINYQITQNINDAISEAGKIEVKTKPSKSQFSPYVSSNLKNNAKYILGYYLSKSLEETDQEAALSVLKEIADSNPYAQLIIVQLLYKRKKYNDAESYVTSLKNSNDKALYYNALYYSASIRYNQSTYDKSSEEFKKLVDEYEQWKKLIEQHENYIADCYYYLGESYRFLNPPKNQDAWNAYMKLWETYPQHEKSPDGLFEMIVLYDSISSHNKYQKDDLIDRFLKQYPKHKKASQLYLSQGTRYLNNSSYIEALNSFEQINFDNLPDNMPKDAQYNIVLATKQLIGKLKSEAQALRDNNRYVDAKNKYNEAISQCELIKRIIPSAQNTIGEAQQLIGTFPEDDEQQIPARVREIGDNVTTIFNSLNNWLDKHQE